MVRRTIYIAEQQRRFSVTATTNTTDDTVLEPVVTEAETPPEAPVEATVAEEFRADGAGKRKGKARAQTRIETARDEIEVSGTERNEEMATETNYFTAFAAFPGAQAFEKLFADMTGRSEEFAKRSRKAAEELADIARANVDAVVESGKIATGGAQSIGQQVLAKGRDNIDHAANTVRALAEAKTPADVLQAQSDFFRGAFDRFVEETANLTESLVKVAGEAFEPISTRASLNVERFNEIVA
jgi:phasin family protein